MKLSYKKDNILECLKSESKEELIDFQNKRLVYWDDFEKIIKNFSDGIKNNHDAGYVDAFIKEMKVHSKTVKEINKALKDEEKILEY